MMTIIITILLFIEHRNNWLTKEDWRYAIWFAIVDIVDFIVAYLLFK